MPHLNFGVSHEIPDDAVPCRYELLMQYFQIKLNFSIKDQSHMFVLAGLCGMFTQLVLLRVLLRFISKRDLLLVGRVFTPHGHFQNL